MLSKFRVLNVLEVSDYTRNEVCRKCELERITRENRRKVERRQAWLRTAKGREYLRKLKAGHSRMYCNRRRAAQPLWADVEKIDEFYERARVLTETTGIEHHVDHMVPLKHENVCGLHIHQNLQVLTNSENCRKSNSFSCE